MAEQLELMFEAFKQELTDIYTTNDNAISCLFGVWRGEASEEYIYALRTLGECISTVIRQTECLQEKVNVFAGSQHNTDTSI